MEILFVSDAWAGSHKVRIELPKRELEKRGHKASITSLKHFPYDSRPDVAVFLRGFRADVRACLSHLRFIGTKIVYDTDDALDIVPPQSPVYWHYRSMLQNVIVLWQEADLVTTTTEQLASHLQTRNSNVAILPNCVDPEEWGPIDRLNGPCRVGFQGGETHMADVLLIVEPLMEISQKYDIDFVIQGIAPQGKTLEAWYDHCSHVGGQIFHKSSLGKQLSNLLCKLENMQYNFFPSVSLTEHPSALQALKLDIGLCPLRMERFNCLKSCLKFYEYAMAGAVTIASRITPFTNELSHACTTANTFDSWYETLAVFIADPCKRADTAASQREWVLSNRAIGHTIALWENAYASL